MNLGCNYIARCAYFVFSTPDLTLKKYLSVIEPHMIEIIEIFILISIDIRAARIRYFVNKIL